MSKWLLRVGVMLLCGTVLGTLPGCGHDPNHDIDLEKARKAADQIHPPPPPGVKMEPGHGG